MTSATARVVWERKNRFSGTTVRLVDFREDPEWADPGNPWSVACEIHQDGAQFPTRTAAERVATSPPDWCGGCEEEWVERALLLEDAESEADLRTSVNAWVISTVRLSCGCVFPPSEPLRAIESIEPGFWRACPKHRTPELIEKVIKEFVFDEEVQDVREALAANRRPKLVRPARIDRRISA